MSQLLTRPETTPTPRHDQDRPVPRRVRPINVNKGLLLVRVVIGGLFVGHGCQKLFGWFGGPGLQGWTESLAKNGLEPAGLWAAMEGVAELGSGLFLVLGLLTPLVTAVLIGDMLVAIFEVHASKGLWSQNGGFEYNLVLIATLVCVGLIGSGIYSLDRRLPALPRPHTFFAALIVTLIVVGVAVVPGHLPSS